MDKTIYKNITIFKTKDTPATESKLPTHTIQISDDKFENKKTVGSLWTRDSVNGKFLSGKLSDNYTKKDGTQVDEYVIVSKNYLQSLSKQEVKVGGLDVLDEPPF